MNKEKLLQTASRLNNELIEGTKPKYNKHTLSAVSYFAIGLTIVFCYFINPGLISLVIGVLLMILGGYLFQKFKV